MESLQNISIELEVFTAERFSELMPLAQMCWDECTPIKAETCAYHGDRNFKIEPNYDVYKGLEDNGRLIYLAMRSRGELIGYMIGLIYNSLHHKPVLCAAGDSIFIVPKFRSYSAILVSKFESEAGKRGAEVIGWPTHINGPVYELLKSLGYIGDDIVMEKRIEKLIEKKLCA